MFLGASKLKYSVHFNQISIEIPINLIVFRTTTVYICIESCCWKIATTENRVRELCKLQLKIILIIDYMHTYNYIMSFGAQFNREHKNRPLNNCVSIYRYICFLRIFRYRKFTIVNMDNEWYVRVIWFHLVLFILCAIRCFMSK